MTGCSVAGTSFAEAALDFFKWNPRTEAGESLFNIGINFASLFPINLPHHPESATSEHFALSAHAQLVHFFSLLVALLRTQVHDYRS